MKNTTLRKPRQFSRAVPRLSPLSHCFRTKERGEGEEAIFAKHRYTAVERMAKTHRSLLCSSNVKTLQPHKWRHAKRSSAEDRQQAAFVRGHPGQVGNVFSQHDLPQICQRKNRWKLMNRNSPDHSAALQPPPPPFLPKSRHSSQSHHAGSPATAQNGFQNLSRPSVLPRPPEPWPHTYYFEPLWPVMRRRRLLCAVASMLPTFLSQHQWEG